MSFAQRVLKFSFSGAASGSFSTSGLRAAVSIQLNEGRFGTQGQVKIWGLSMDQINRYSASFPAGIAIENYSLTIEAGELGG